MSCETSHLCQFFVCFKAVRSCESELPSSFDDPIGGLDGSGVTSSLVASIRRCVWDMLMKLILQTWEQEGRQETDFVSVLNAIRLRAQLSGCEYFHHDPCYL